jgi:DNA (cytosine-5)-methyltransferase 1
MITPTKLDSAKQFIEFFAGIGLVRYALEKSGWECLYANDFDPKKQEQYEAKFGKTHFHLGDIFATDEVASRLPRSVTLATASFPCVDLSLAGHWKGIDGKHSSAVFGFLDCVRKIEPPQILLLENVVGLLSSNGGKDFMRLATLLSELGYWLDAFQLDAKYFVPQSRPRVFIVAVHNSAIERIELPKSTDDFVLGSSWENEVRSHPDIRPIRLTRLMAATELHTGWFCSGISCPTQTTTYSLKDVIDLGDDQEWWDSFQVKKHCDMMHDSHREQIDQFLREGEFFVGTIYRRKRAGRTRAEVRFDGIAGCLRTPKGGSARQIVITTSGGLVRIRWMNPREYARLQGAADFPLVGKTNQQLFGFGDAVCVPVIRWIDDTVLTPIAASLEQVST